MVFIVRVIVKVSLMSYKGHTSIWLTKSEHCVKHINIVCKKINAFLHKKTRSFINVFVYVQKNRIKNCKVFYE